MISIVTSMNKMIFELYGKKMTETALTHWPPGTVIYSYYDGPKPEFEHPRVVWIDLIEQCPGMVAFQKRNRHREGNNYNRQAIRFSFKSFAIWHAIRNVKDRYLIFLGADVLTHSDISAEIVRGWFCERFSCYLGRKDYHSETDFIGFDLESESAQFFADKWIEYWASDKIFSLDYWHDCGVYDDIRERFPLYGFRDLSPWGQKPDHVFIQSELGRYMDHTKGPRRKAKGNSMKKELNGRNLDVPYWKDK